MQFHVVSVDWLIRVTGVWITDFPMYVYDMVEQTQRGLVTLCITSGCHDDEFCCVKSRISRGIEVGVSYGGSVV